MSQPSDVSLGLPSDVSGASLDVASAHVPSDDKEQRSISIAAARDDDSEALISKAADGENLNEASQILGAQSRPSSSEFVVTLGPSVDSSSVDSAKVLLDGSSANAGGSNGGASANGGSEASVRPPVFRSALSSNRHGNGGNNTPVRPTNAGFRPQTQFGGNRPRYNSDNGGYMNQLRGAHGWNGPRVPSTNPYMWMPMPPQQGHGRPFIAQRPPTGPPPYAFMPHQAPPFTSPMGYPDDTSSYYATPFFETYNAYPPSLFETNYARPPPPPLPNSILHHQMPLPVSQGMTSDMVVDKQLVLKKQIEYYFSVNNLCKDVFLRSNMDPQGWVPISLIATFKRVKSVTTNTNYILNALRSSTIIEIQGENIRRRNDWMKWVLPSTPKQSL